jgi:hypothetical protein
MGSRLGGYDWPQMLFSRHKLLRRFPRLGSLSLPFMSDGRVLKSTLCKHLYPPHPLLHFGLKGDAGKVALESWKEEKPRMNRVNTRRLIKTPSDTTKTFVGRGMSATRRSVLSNWRFLLRLVFFALRFVGNICCSLQLIALSTTNPTTKVGKSIQCTHFTVALVAGPVLNGLLNSGTRCLGDKPLRSHGNPCAVSVEQVLVGDEVTALLNDWGALKTKDCLRFKCHPFIAMVEFNQILRMMSDVQKSRKTELGSLLGLPKKLGSCLFDLRISVTCSKFWS